MLFIISIMASITGMRNILSPPRKSGGGGGGGGGKGREALNYCNWRAHLQIEPSFRLLSARQLNNIQVLQSLSGEDGGRGGGERFP